MNPVRIEIAATRLDLRWSGPVSWLVERYGAFARGGGPARWTLEARSGPPPAMDRYTGRATRAGGRVVVEGAEHLGWLDASARRGEVETDRSLLVLDSLVRAALSLDVLGRGGLLLHAATAVLGGVAHLTPGRSGSGKSTFAALAGDALGEELCAVLPGPCGFQVHGTPWRKGRPGSAPLAGVYRLAWDGEGVVPLRRADGLRHLATNLVLPVDGPEERALAFAAAGRIAAAVPFARLAFRPDSDVDAILRRHAPARAA